MLSSLDFSHHDETGASLAHGVGDQLGRLGFTLSPQDSGFGLLFALEDKEFGALGSLLGNLLLLNGTCELARELQVGDRHVVENDVELKGAFAEHFSDFLGDLLSL